MASVNLTIPAASASAEMTLTIPVMDDVINDADETLRVTGTTTVGSLTVTEAPLTITDNDDAPTVITLALSPSSVAEDVGDAAITVTATLEGTTTRSEETVVSLSTADVTATAGADYTAVASVNLTIPVASDHAEMTLTIPVTNDVITEADETLRVMGTTTVGLTVTDALLTITDDEPTGGITLALNPSSVAEDVGNAAITVTATLTGGARSEETVVSLSTADGTASAGADYTAVASVNLTIPAASASADMTLTIPVMDDVIDEGASETLSVMGTTTVVGLTVTPAHLTITDDDDAHVVVSEASLTVPEDGGMATYTVVLGSRPTADVTITPTSDDRMAARASAALTFTTSNWNAAQTVTVTGVNDDIDNTGDARTATVSHTVASTDTNYNGGSITINSVTVTVTDDDLAPDGITLTLSPNSVREDVGDAAITVTATLTGGGTRTEDTVVSLSTADVTASAGADYMAPASVNLTIPATIASATATLTIPVTNDVINEVDETLRVTGTTTVGSLTVTEAPLTITDNDNAPTVITLALSPNSIAEDVGDAAITVTATLEGTTTRSEDTVVSLGTADGTATAGADYTAVASVNLTIPAASDHAEMTLTIPVTNDVITEADETLRVTGTTTVGLTVTDALLTITDDEPTGGITLALNPSSVAEDVGNAAITVTATLTGGARSEETVVSLGTADGTATAGVDYTAVASVNLTIPATSASAEMTLTIPVMDDVIDEGTDETLSVMGTTTVVGLIVTPAHLTITDDDDAHVVVSEASLTVPEDGGMATYTVVLGSRPTADVTITPTSDDRMAARASAALTFTTSNWDAAQTVTVTGVNDDIDNTGDARTATVSHTVASTDTNYNGGSITINSVTVTVTDDDLAPDGITLTLSPNSVREDVGDAAITVTATLTGGGTRTEDTVVSLSTADVTASAGVDYTAPASVNLTIPATIASATATLTIPVTNDVINEVDETLRVTGTTTVGSLTVTEAPLTITDNDNAPTVITLALSPNSVAEDVGDAAITVTATLEGTTTRSEDTVVSLGTADGTATAGADYTAVASVNLTIPTASASAEMTLTIPVTNDVINEADETLSVMGTTTVAGLTVTPADLTITDDDNAPTGITLALSPNSVAEDVGDASITVTAILVGTTRSEDTVVSLGTADNTATAGADYTAVASVNLTIPATSASAEMTLTIPVMDDVIDEGTSETLSVMGMTTAGLTVTPADLTIIDDDAPTGITLALSPNSVAEDVGNAAITVTATLEGTTRSEETVVSLGTADGTATAGVDYTAVASVNLTIPAASASAEMTLTISVMDDVIDEGTDETLSVMGMTTAGLTVTPADLTITDDDNAPTGITLALNPSSVAEDVGNAAITVTATLVGTTRSEETVVSLSTADGTATAGVDYTAVASVNLTIPAASASAEMTLTIPVMDDVIDEVDETLRVTGTTTVGSLTVAEAPLTITDNDDSPAEEITEQLNEQVLPQVFLKLANVGSRLIADRLSAGAIVGGGAISDQSPGGEAGSAGLMEQLEQWLSSDAAELELSRRLRQLDTFDLRDLIDDLAFSADGERIGMPTSSLYGIGNYSHLAGDEDGMNWNGDLYSGLVGIDTRLRDDVLAGVLLSYTEGEFEYTDAAIKGGGKYDLNVSSVNPYIGWSPSDDLDLWASVGYGVGEVELDDSDGPRSSDLNVGSISVAANGRLYASGAVSEGGRNELRLRGDATLSRVNFDLSSAGFGDVSSHRLRMILEASHSRNTESGGSLRGTGEIGLRHDGGDGQSGQGMEVGVGLEWRDAARGLTLSGRTRLLALADYEEWGISGALRLAPGQGGRGLSFSLSPGYGRDSSGVKQLWDRGASDVATSNRSAALRMDGEVGYGLWLLGGTVRPYLGASLLEGGDRTQRLGASFDLGHGVKLELKGSRRERTDADADHRIELQWQWNW